MHGVPRPSGLPKDSALGHRPGDLVTEVPRARFSPYDISLQPFNRDIWFDCRGQPRTAGNSANSASIVLAVRCSLQSVDAAESQLVDVDLGQGRVRSSPAFGRAEALILCVPRYAPQPLASIVVSNVSTAESGSHERRRMSFRRLLPSR